MGAWLSPVVLAALVGRVVAGEGSVPLLVSAIVAAPLLAMLVAAVAHDPAPTPRGDLADLTVLIALTLVLVANLAVLGDIARALGGTRVEGIAAGALGAIAVALWPGRPAWLRIATPIGVALLVAPLGLVGLTAGAPWTTWTTIASQSTLTFDAGSPWVTRGRAFDEGATLTFDEAHRVVAAAPGTWRVVDRSTPGVAFREWKLAAGDALTLRPGDQLSLEAGARLRFEPGRRIPGAPASGIAWADGRTAGPLLAPFRAVGLITTLAIGAVGLVLATAPGGIERRGSLLTLGAPALLLVFALGMAAWGLYGVAVAPELAIAPPAFATVVELTTRVGPPSWRGGLTAAVATGVALLFVGVAGTWRAAAVDAMRGLYTRSQGAGPPPLAFSALMAALVVTAIAIAVVHGDAWQWFLWGLGLAASAVAAPRLAKGGGRGEAAGVFVGTVTFGLLVVTPGSVPAVFRPFADAPALIAAPLAWLTARLFRERGKPTRR